MAASLSSLAQQVLMRLVGKKNWWWFVVIITLLLFLAQRIDAHFLLEQQMRAYLVSQPNTRWVSESLLPFVYQQPVITPTSNTKTVSSQSGQLLTQPADHKPQEVVTRAQVVQVVDGDTVVVKLLSESGLEQSTTAQAIKIRIIGINTPETVDPRKTVECFGKEASAQATHLLQDQVVWLETDRSQADKDAYGRWLRYLWLDEGERDYGWEMIRLGYAFEYTYQKPYHYQAQYRLAQQQAQSQMVGLWQSNQCEYNQTR